MIEADKLRATFDTLKSRGLKDIKLTFGPLAGCTLEEVCRDVNVALVAILNGDYEDMPPLGDSVRPKEPV